MLYHIVGTHFYICRVLAKCDYISGRQSNAQYDNVRRHNYGASRMPVTDGNEDENGQMLGR